MCASSIWFGQLRLLLWKNYLLKKRRAVSSCCELLVPLLAVLILVALRAIIKPEQADERIFTTDSVSCEREALERR